MQGRSWMAALTLTLSTALTPSLTAGAGEKPVTHKVRLQLFIAGLKRSGGGCDVEIKPGHSGCRFRPITRHIKADGLGYIELDDVQTASADKECAFAITMVEPGQPVKTVYKGLRLHSKNASGLLTLDCYLSSPSKTAIAREEQNKKRR